ncbi:hypothetical protein BDN72DRAFT_501205 [Pluteus cervinus]|uniref:Uncharacterized protein n=1 Tax=Pluteus cervinus TaxID=181527 RepID=A0ACD3A4V5_9AGAR|nr:hypothetical protein BDN72DRAFT_501205 [Pluteus cervinus]
MSPSNSSLSRILQHLKVPRKSWHIFVMPDPRECQGFQRLDTGKYEFRIKLETNPDMAIYYSENPTFWRASNIVSSDTDTHRNLRSSRDKENFYTEWIRIIEKTPAAPVPNAAGTDNPPRIWDAMTQLMERFPKHDLQTEQGVEKAIEDIESMLKPIATFEDLEGQY